MNSLPRPSQPQLPPQLSQQIPPGGEEWGKEGGQRDISGEQNRPGNLRAEQKVELQRQAQAQEGSARSGREKGRGEEDGGGEEWTEYKPSEAPAGGGGGGGGGGAPPPPAANNETKNLVDVKVRRFEK